MLARILTLLLTLAASCQASNVGLLVEWIQVDHQSANLLLQQFAEEDNANALREELETRLDLGRAELVETTYLVSKFGQRAKVESHLEFMYSSEAEVDYLSADFLSKKPFKNGQWPKRDLWPGTCGLPSETITFDVRNIGNALEVEPKLNPDGSLEFNLALEHTSHLEDRLVGDPKFALGGTVQPTFRSEGVQTNFITNNGEDFLISLLTPKNDSDQRIFLIARANLLEPKRKAKPGDIQFSSLPKGTTLTIDYFSNGCFHNTATRLAISGKTVTVTQLTPKEKRIGKLTLSDQDLQKLDKTLEFYRNIASVGGCTTRDAVSFKLHRDGKEIAFEKHLDGTCSIDRQEGLLPFYELLARPLQK